MWAVFDSPAHLHINRIRIFRAIFSPCPPAGSNNTAFQFFPAPVSVVSSSAPSATWQGDGCFTSMSASTAFDANGATVTLTGTGATSFLCSDYYLVASSFGVSLGSVGALGATTSIRFNYTGPDEIVDVSLNGLNIMVLPCGLLGTVTSVLNTVDLFNGTQTELQDRNINFLMDRGVWPAPAELFNVTVPIDTSAVQSGDYLAITRFDGACNQKNGQSAQGKPSSAVSPHPHPAFLPSLFSDCPSAPTVPLPHPLQAWTL